jgi:hypothetical protein
MNRRSFTCDMELDCAVLHKPSVHYHLANLAHMATGQPWTDFGADWLHRLWAAIANLSKLTMIPEPFFRDASTYPKATPNGVVYAAGGNIPASSFEPTSLASDVETANASQFPGSPKAAGRLDQIVYLIEQYTVGKPTPTASSSPRYPRRDATSSRTAMTNS